MAGGKSSGRTSRAHDASTAEWVVAAIPRVLEYLPANHPDRPRIEQMFKDMADKVLSCQQSDGLWRASLLDPVNFPAQESSSSAMFISSADLA